MTKQQKEAIDNVLGKIKYSQINHNRYRKIASSRHATPEARKHAQLCSDLMDMVVANRVEKAKK